MLVLSRKLLEQIQIGENITVTVVHVKGKVVKLGIDAPRNIRILRTEIISGGEKSGTGDEPVSQTRTLAKLTEDEPTGEDDAGGTEVCHGRLARPCSRTTGTHRGVWASRRTRGGTGSVVFD